MRAETGERHRHSQAGAGGFTREQVTALAEYLDEQLARKSDLNELVLRLDHRITEVQSRLDHRITEVESRLKLWMVGQVFVIVGVLGTLGYFR
jgi:hypothetical protein